MSSRNQYLSGAERERAGAIHATLRWIEAQVLAGEAPGALEPQAMARLEEAGLRPEYAAIRSAQDLAVPEPGRRRDLVALDRSPPRHGATDRQPVDWLRKALAARAWLLLPGNTFRIL